MDIYIKKKEYLSGESQSITKSMIKNPPENFDSSRVYHIYAKNRCLYHNLNVEDFKEKWEMLNIMVGILKTDYQPDDLSYESIGSGMGYPSDISWPEPSGGDSY